MRGHSVDVNDEHAHLKGNIRHLRHVLQKDLIQATDFDKKIAHNQLSLNTIKMSTAEWKEYITMSA
jgi:transcriptional regulator with AAA-type ATPase domain